MSMDDSLAADMSPFEKIWQDEQENSEKARQSAWKVSRRLADKLRSQFKATQVLAYGPLVRSGPFDKHSPVELAVTGIAPDQFARALAVTKRMRSEFELELVDLNECSTRLGKQIKREGIAV
jgi:predicted nucleotidyltransferase